MPPLPPPRKIPALIIHWSYISHTLVILTYAPFVMKFLIAIFILFSTWLYN